MAQSGDTLWGLAGIVYNNGARWTEFGFKRDPRTLQIGEVIKVGGGSSNSTKKKTTPQFPSLTIQIPSGEILTPGSKEPDWSVIKDDSFAYDSSAKATVKDYFYWIEWGTKSTGATLLKLMPDATKAYNHYRSGKGTDLWVDLNKAYREDSGIRGFFDALLEKARVDAVKMFSASGTPKNFGAYNFTSGLIDTSTLGFYPTTENWRKALGGFSAWVHGTLSIQKYKYVLNVTISVRDWYNFDNGKYDIDTGTPDAVNGRFQQLGWAKPFVSYGSFDQSIIWIF